ncbi:MAG: PLP-dependent transferase [Acidobacteria bacterium]|nr:PLP-dependent transferase [Acidobacteriota bacterium]
MKKNLATRLSRLGEGTRPSITPAKSLPITWSSVFAFDSLADLEAVYQKEAAGHIYTRLGNPVHDALQEILADIEEGRGARAYASGMGAVAVTILGLLRSGDHLLADTGLYGGTYQLFNDLAARFGIAVTFADLKREDPADHLRDKTRLIYLETISNPLMEVADIRRIAAAAHRQDCRVAVDSTFASPVICRPLSLGADVVIHSATKYLCGHSDVMGGVVVAADPAVLEEIHRAGVLYGPTLSPMDAWLLIRSLRTLDLRMRRHAQNALALAGFFAGQPHVGRVFYPGLSDSPFHDIARRQFSDGLCGGMLSLELTGGKAAAERFLGNLEGIKFLPSLAGYSTSVSYPAATSHRGLTKEARAKAGIGDGLIRVSAGLEDSADLRAEFTAILERV